MPSSARASCPRPRSTRRSSLSAMASKFPEKNYDDFAGLDIRGKIIVIFSGSPSEIPGALASHYQTAAERWKVLRAAGRHRHRVVDQPRLHGYSLVPHRAQPRPSHHGSRLSRVRRNRRRQARRSPSILRALKNSLPAPATLSKKSQLSAKIASRCRTFRSPFRSAAKTKVEVTKIESANLVAKLPGSDPASEGRIRGALRPPRSHRHRRAHQRRPHLQRRHGQRLRQRPRPRHGCELQEESGEAAPVDPPGPGNRRRKGTARLKVLRRASHGRAEIDRRRC